MLLSTTPPIMAITSAARQAIMNDFMKLAPPPTPIAFDYNKYEDVASDVKNLSADRLAMLQCNALGVRSVFRSIDVEERIDRLVTEWRGQGRADIPGGVGVARVSGVLVFARSTA